MYSWLTGVLTFYCSQLSIELNHPGSQLHQDSNPSTLSCIHTELFYSVIQNVIDHKPKLNYLVAVDDSKNTIEDIVKVCESLTFKGTGIMYYSSCVAYSKTINEERVNFFGQAIAVVLGPGKIHQLPKEDAFLICDLQVRGNIQSKSTCCFVNPDSKCRLSMSPQQRDIDALLVYLRMEAVYLKDKFNIHWVRESGLVENIERVVEEYKQTRELLVSTLNLLTTVH